MTVERMGAGPGIGPEPVVNAGAVETAGVTDVLRLQILSTEHWSLLATRSLAWNESFSRAGMFLSTLSGAMVALALVAQASAFGDGFALFALIILPIVLFVGVTTYVRLGASNAHDGRCVLGMNRIRAAYLELAPDLERYFVMGTTDDPRGMSLTMGMTEQHVSLGVVLASTPAVIGVLNSVLGAMIVAVISLRLGSGVAVALAAGAIGFLLAMVVHNVYTRRNIRKVRSGLTSMFPSREEPPDAEV